MSAVLETVMGAHLLLLPWEAHKSAIVAHVAAAGFGDAAEPALERFFEHLATAQPEPLRRAVRELVRFDREHQPDAKEDVLSAFHHAVLEALRPHLESAPPESVLQAMSALSLAFQSCASIHTEIAQLEARHASERKAAELERALSSLSAAQETLLHQARLKAMGALADGVAHDVNNALNAVLLRTTLLRRSAPENEQAHLEAIERTVRHAAATVQRLQEFARRREGRSRAACDPVAVVREAVELTRPHWLNRSRLEGGAIDVRVDTPATVSPAQIEASEFRAILVDLLLNATEAIPGRGHIDITVREEGRTVLVEVADDGPGIPPEHLRRIFEPFFTTRGPRSSGLGLAMAWGVMDRVGGQIVAANRPEGGASFRLVLPVAAVESEDTASRNLRARSVLVVDDDRDSREALEQLLLLRGHDVDIAIDGKHALEIYRADRHEAVLCDVSMPNMNGLQLARAIRARNPDALIALLTGWGPEVADEERNIVDAVFRKPLDLEALAGFLERTSIPRDGRDPGPDVEPARAAKA